MSTLSQHRFSSKSASTLQQRMLPCGMEMGCSMAGAGPLLVSGAQLYRLAFEAARRSVQSRENARRVAASN